MDVNKSYLGIEELITDVNNEVENENDLDDTKKEYIKPFLKQLIFSNGTALATLLSGMSLGYVGILFPQLEENPDQVTFILDIHNKSWIGSISILSVCLGSISSGFISHSLGKKISLHIGYFLSAVGFIISSLSYDLSKLLLSRVITGFSVGLILAAAIVYISEMTDPKNRTFFLSFVVLYSNLGVLVVHSVGSFYTWQTTSFVCSFVSIIGIPFLFIFPESSAWLVDKKKFNLGIQSFRYMRGRSCENELYDLLQIQKEKETYIKENMKFKDFKEPEVWKPFIIANVYFITAQWSGYNILAVYAIEILHIAFDDDTNNYLGVFFIDIVRVLSSFIFIALTKFFKVRTLSMLSGVLSTIVLGSLSVILYVIKLYPKFIPPNLILCLLILYMLAVSFGLKSLPWMLVSELFPVKYRNILSGICESFSELAMFLVLNSAPYLIQYLNLQGAFCLYCLVTMFGTIFLYFTLPETKGKTLIEIENSFKTDDFIRR